MDNTWLALIRELIALAHSGLAYSQNVYDSERYQHILQLAEKMLLLFPTQFADQLNHIWQIDGHYATPKLDIRIAIFNAEQNILLVREAADGLWSLPGGWADINQSPVENACKEVLEECGLHVRIRKLAALYDRRKHPHPPMLAHVYKLFFIADIAGGTLRTNHETLAAEFFAEHDLPPLSLNRVTPEQIARMFMHARQPEHPTDTD